MDSMIHAVLQATFISKCVLALLLCMSLASWAFMAGKWLMLRSAKKRIVGGMGEFEALGELSAALAKLESDSTSPLFGISKRAANEFNRLNATGDIDRLLNDNVRRIISVGIEEEMAKLKSSMALLATTANTAPFIGLFGTVWGIMHSFQAIATMKSVSLATVAPGIAEALIATAVGLFVAIPATCGFNLFKSKLSGIQSDCINFAAILLNRLQHESARHPEGVRFAGRKA